MFKKYSINFIFVAQLLIIVALNLLYTNIAFTQERIVKVNNSLEDPVFYSCRDSIYANLYKEVIILYGEAEVKYQDITLTADHIEMDMRTKTVTATYTKNEDGERIGIPHFTQGADALTAASLKYNFDSQKAYIKELDTKQQENYLHMGIAKRQTNGELHFKQGRFTTCDLEEPHFHFQLSKAVLVPEKRIATGPVNLWVKGVPTPLGLPFAFLPMQKQKQTGIIFPGITPASAYGFGLQDLGYYFPIKKSENIQTTVYGSIYSRGTFGLKNVTDYKKRYKYNGNFLVSYDYLKRPFPDTTFVQKLTLRWTHKQEAKANPYWTFNSKVNFVSDNDSKTTLDPLSNQLLNNQFNSDINLSRKIGKLVTTGLKASVKQSTQSGTLDFNLPTFTVNVNRFYPFKVLKRKSVVKKRFFEKIGMTYNLESKNQVKFNDTLLKNRQWDLIRNQQKNGVNHRAAMTVAIPMFKNTVTLTPSVNYAMRWNFQSTEKYYDSNSGSIRDSLLRNQFGVSQNASLNAQLSTSLYSYYRFVGKRKVKMRHVLTPTLKYSYIPRINNNYFSDSIFNGTSNQLVEYSPYQNSLYAYNNNREQSLITYGINNTFELKSPSKKDTVTGFKKLRIIDAFTINGNYDALKDSLNFSDISLSLRSSPLPSLNFVARGSFSPYGWDQSTGATLSKFALDTNGRLGRFMNTNFSTTYVLTTKKSKEKIEENQNLFAKSWEGDYNYYTLHPYEVIDFDIPWKLSFTHTIFNTLNRDTSTYLARKNNTTQSLALNGDVSFTKRWKAVFSTNINLEEMQLNQTRLSLNRDMHCWQLAFTSTWNYTPTGVNQSFIIRINATSALFKDADIKIRKPPEFL